MQTFRLPLLKSAPLNLAPPATQPLIGDEAGDTALVSPQASEALTTCLNCHAPNVEAFCPRCGQERGAHVAPIREMVLDAAGAFLQWEGRLMQTLRGLLRPGFLTTEYLAGRRVPYVAPFRMYLWAIGLYVLVFSLVGVEKQVEQAMLTGQAISNPAKQQIERTAPVTAAPPPTSWGEMLRADYRQIRETERAEKMRRLENQTRQIPIYIFEHLTFIFIASQPLCAALLHLLYRRQRRLYAEQLITILHNETAILLFTIPFLFVPNAMTLKGFVSFGIYPIYYFFSLRRVYGGFPRQTVPKTLLKMCLYFVLVATLLLLVSLGFGVLLAVTTSR